MDLDTLIKVEPANSENILLTVLNHIKETLFKEQNVKKNFNFIFNGLLFFVIFLKSYSANYNIQVGIYKGNNKTFNRLQHTWRLAC